MKKEGRRTLVLSILALSLVLALGSIAFANGTSGNCPTRWGEPIGIGCRTVAAPTSEVRVEVEATAEYEPKCATRWGEPVGVGCRIPAKVAKISKELDEAERGYTINCPTRWGEPIGINCRVPVTK